MCWGIACIHLPKHCLSIFPSAGCPASEPIFSYHLFSKLQMCTVLGSTSALKNPLPPVSERAISLQVSGAKALVWGVSKSGCRHLVSANKFFLNSRPRAMQLFLCPWEERTRPWTPDVFQQNTYTKPSAVCQWSVTCSDRC